MAIWNTAREEIIFTDSLRGSIGVLNIKSGNIEAGIEVFAGKARKVNQKVIERDGYDGLFAQPTRICVKGNTIIMVHSAAKIRNIDQIVIGLQEVYEFEKVCVNNVRRYYEASTQGPHGTASTVAVKDEERILYRRRNLRKDFEDLRPRLLETFDIRSILTLCVENVFSEMRSGAADVPLQLEFDRSFPRAIESFSEDCT